MEQYLDVNKWQIKGIQEALSEANSPEARLETMVVVAATGMASLHFFTGQGH